MVLSDCRSGQVLQLLASGHITNLAPSEQPYPADQQQWPSTADVYRRITADAVHCSDQAAPSGGQATASDASNSTHAGLQQPAGPASTSSYTSSAADGGSWQHDSSCPAAGGLEEAQVHAGPSAHSAYFPAHAASGSHRQQQPMPSLQAQQHPQPGSMLAGTSPGFSSQQHVGSSVAKGSTQAAVPTASSPSSAGAPATWQESLQQGLFIKLAQQGDVQGRTGLQSWPGQQQQNRSIGTSRMQQAGAGAAGEHHHHQQHQQEAFLHAAVGQASQQAGFADVSTGFEVDDVLLSTSSSSHSAHSELLDSDDLDELAGLCDSLLHRHESSQTIDHTAAALQDAYSTLQQERQQHIQQELAGTTWGGSAASGAAQQHSEQQYRHVSMPGIPKDAASQACVPGLQALAAQLRQLQEQVSATAMDAAPACGTSSSVGSLRGARSSSTPNQQPPAWGSSGGSTSAHAGVDQQSYVAGVQRESAQQHNRRAGQHRGSTGSSSSGLWPPGHAQHEVDEGPAMTGLQQQLAQRMQEVKERLSNICNGMLQDGVPFEVPEPGSDVPVSSSGAPPSSSGVPASSSFWSPPTSPPVRPQSSSTSKASAGSARVAAAVGGCSTGSKATKTAARTPAAGKVASPVLHKPGTAAGSVHSYYSNFAKRAASAKTAAASSMFGPVGARPGPAGAAVRGQPHPDSAHDAAAAFASIKASIDSTASVPGFFNISSTAPAASGTGSRPRVDGHPAAAASTAAAAAADCASGLDSSGPPAAACQGSWASASDAAATEDSEGSWATVDDSEQEQLQHQLHQQAVNERQRQQMRAPVSSSQGYSRHSAGHSSSPGLDRTGTQPGSHPVPGWHHQQEDQENKFLRSEACFVGAACHSPQRAAQDCEQPASPISCESSRLSAAARMPAEVVFSPMKGG